ncbi:MAG: hypothetical protein ACOCRZ_07620 [Halothermotrichaceae bacterium]
MKCYKKVSIVLAMTLLVFMFFCAEVNCSDYENESLPLPEGYPEDLLPLMEGYNLISFNLKKSDEQQEIWLKYMLNIEDEKVATYYKDILNQGKLNSFDTWGIYTLTGELEGKDIEIKITEERMHDNFQSIVQISLIGNIDFLGMNNTGNKFDISSANNNIKDIDILPEDYPLELIPISGGSKVTYGQKQEYDGTEFVIQTYSKDEKESVINFYKGILQDAINIEEGVMQDEYGILYTLGGIIETYKVSYVISDNTMLGDGYKTINNINIKILKD